MALTASGLASRRQTHLTAATESFQRNTGLQRPPAMLSSSPFLPTATVFCLLQTLAGSCSCSAQLVLSAVVPHPQHSLEEDPASASALPEGTQALSHAKRKTKRLEQSAATAAAES